MPKISELSPIIGSRTKSGDLFVTVSLEDGDLGTKNITRRELVNAIQQEEFQSITVTGGSIANTTITNSSIVNPNVSVSTSATLPLDENDYFILRDISNQTTKISFSDFQDQILQGLGFVGSVGFIGSTGFTGSKGDIGFTGSVGFTGSTGIGFTGSAGVGFTGSKGDIGFTGSTGFAGSKGDIGFTGSTGIGFTGSAGVGFTGSKGDIGFTGSSGTNGFTGSVGFVGSQGSNGFTGSIGFTGSAGAGADITITDDTATDETRYVTFVNATSGIVDDVFVSSSKLFYNPATGILNATEFNSLSDVTYKEDFRTIDNAVELLDRINTYQFKWKETGVNSYGVIAQELEEILPELINNTNGSKYVNYVPLIAILLEGYKNLSKQVKDLQK
jgi:hypothetical protein